MRFDSCQHSFETSVQEHALISRATAACCRADAQAPQSFTHETHKTRKRENMGSSQGKPTAPVGMSPAASVAVGVPPTVGSGGGGSADFKPAPCSAMREASAASGDPVDGSCPVPEEYRGNLGVYNVYNTRIDGGDAAAAQAGGEDVATAKQKRGWFGGWFGGGGGGGKGGNDGIGGVVLDPRNNMPVVARQSMAPGQKTPISTSRQQSTIPKSGTGSTWLYPSPQMFYNSLVRRDEGEHKKGGQKPKKTRPRPLYLYYSRVPQKKKKLFVLLLSVFFFPTG